MKPLLVALLILILHMRFFGSQHLWAAPVQIISHSSAVTPTATIWQSTSAEHVYGFPEIKPNKKGILTLSPESLTFSGKYGNSSIPRNSVTAVSAGNQRVELWGIKGRILRMAIPEGGGVVAATFMHHRVDMLTIEFHDDHGGNHGAVFFLPANEADHALQSFAQTPAAQRKPSHVVCENGPVGPKSVLISAPGWDAAEVPSAYRTLVYEHVIDRLRHTQDVGHVYRDGENNGRQGCPQYVLNIAIETFRPGSQVQRAYMGPAGMFVGTTQMTFNTTLTDASGKLNVRNEVKATTRGESESTSVTDKVAKTVAKQFSTALRDADETQIVKPANAHTP